MNRIVSAFVLAAAVALSACTQASDPFETWAGKYTDEIVEIFDEANLIANDLLVSLDDFDGDAMFAVCDDGVAFMTSVLRQDVSTDSNAPHEWVDAWVSMKRAYVACVDGDLETFSAYVGISSTYIDDLTDQIGELTP